MARMTTLALSLLLISAATVQALTVDEVIKLKRAGVSDSTIDLLIKRSGDPRSAGMWRQDGWIIQSTETRFPDTPQIDYSSSGYSVEVYPRFFGGRRFWPQRR